jgi:hypothetical protein
MFICFLGLITRFILVILTYLWFNFMNNNKDIAAVAGGVSIIDSLTRRR